jgi:hypothetical protein
MFANLHSFNIIAGIPIIAPYSSVGNSAFLISSIDLLVLPTTQTLQASSIPFSSKIPSIVIILLIPCFIAHLNIDKPISLSSEGWGVNSEEITANFKFSSA